MKREGKSEIADWLTESRTRKAIRAGLRTYETYLRRVGEPEVLRRQFEIVKPFYEQLASAGTWPTYGWFTATFGVESAIGSLTTDIKFGSIWKRWTGISRSTTACSSWTLSAVRWRNTRPKALRDRQGEKVLQ